MVLYDVTILFLVAEHEDQLCEVGFSDRRRVDPRIVVRLLTDRAGPLLELTCRKGDKAETLTMLSAVMDFLACNDLRDLVVVTGAGMRSAANLTALDEAGLEFIVCSRKGKALIDLESHLHWRGDAFEDGQIINAVTPWRGCCREVVSDSRFVMNLSGARQFIRT